MLGNFMESSPGPVKFAMAAMGLCEEVYPAADGAAAPGSQEKMLGILKELGLPVVAGSSAADAHESRPVDRLARFFVAFVAALP